MCFGESELLVEVKLGQRPETFRFLVALCNSSHVDDLLWMLREQAEPILARKVLRATFSRPIHFFLELFIDVGQ